MENLGELKKATLEFGSAKELDAIESLLDKSSPLKLGKPRMNNGYIWPVSYTRSGKSGKCETLKMEVQLALYSESKNLLLYFVETDNRELSKTIVLQRLGF